MLNFLFFFLSSGFEIEPQQYFFSFLGLGVLTISAEQYFLSPPCLFISPLYLYIYTALCMNCDIENIVFFWREGGAAEFQESCLYSHTLNGVPPPRLSATNFIESTV